jgi:hypothetical protein
MPLDLEPITTTIPEFRRLSGIGRSRIYELLEAGELESVHIGVRRLILVDSYRRLIERQRQAMQRPSNGRRQSPETHAAAG